MMKICVAGQGAFGQKHLDALKRIADVEVTSLVGGNQDATAEVAKKYGIPHYTGELSEGIKRADAVILTTPTKLHFRQGEQVMRAGKHVLVEIPITDSAEEAEQLVRIAKDTGVVAMGENYRHQATHEVPDTINAVLEYPEGFVVNLSSTFNNQSSAESGLRARSPSPAPRTRRCR